MRFGMVTLSCSETGYLTVHQSQVSLVAFPRNHEFRLKTNALGRLKGGFLRF